MTAAVADLMFHRHCRRALPYLSNTSTTLKYHIFQNPFSTTSKSFVVSYLTTKCGLSPQAALKASKRVHFVTPQKPDSVITFFKNNGFSTSQIRSIIVREPLLLSSDPIKSISPKFQFLASKTATPSDIVTAVSRSPRILRPSLDNIIIPTFDLVSSFCPSHKKTIAVVKACPTSITDSRMIPNVQFLLDVGVTPSSIYHLLRTRPSIICSNDLKNAVEEIKGLGFQPSKINFSIALLAKRAITKSQWDSKVDALKTWGFSEDAIFQAFKKHPQLMLNSADKFNAVISFWVEKLGWNPLILIASPLLFGYSLEKRIIPRASVVKHLLSKGLIDKEASLVTPFCLNDELFMRRYVNRFEKEASSLIKLYQGQC